MSAPRVLLIDNYDSFVGNLYQYFGELGAEPIIRRNDEIAVDEAIELGPTHLVVSPGPRRPEHAGVSVEMIRAFAGIVPILGVCLGHQCIGLAFGGEVVAAKRLVHGKTSEIRHDGVGVLAGVPSPFRATRYHSLSLREDSLPECLEVTARTDDGEIMAVRNSRSRAAIEGLQFHPEAILTEHGRAILSNFLGYRVAPPAGIFETLLVREGRPVLLDEHLDRLIGTADRLGLEVREGRAELRERCLSAADPSPGRMRVSLRESELRVETGPWGGYAQELYAIGADVLLADEPGHPLGLRAGAKVLPYDPLREARARAMESGAFDVVFRTRAGALLEGSASNLFAVIDGVLRTPPADLRILDGVTRRAVLEAAVRDGHPTAEEPIRITDLDRASEVFLTGSLMEVMPVRSLAGFYGAPGPVAATLLRAIREGGIK